MDARPATTIDLKEYGGEGKVVMAAPTAKAQRDLKNLLGGMLHVDEDGNRSGPAGDIEFATMLSCVRSAPFGTDVDAFLDFCDGLSDGGAALVDRMSELAEQYYTGKRSPSQA